MPQNLAMTHCATQNATNHISAVCVRWNYTVCDCETNRTQVVCNYLETGNVFRRFCNASNVGYCAFRIRFNKSGVVMYDIYRNEKYNTEKF